MNTSKTFFIADDDEDDVFFFSEAIREVDESIDVLVARDGAEAMDMLMNSKTTIPLYIFLDLNMPKKSGKECLKEIRKEYRLNDVPVVIYTTSSSEQDKNELLSLGADYFITKYKSFEELRDKLSRLLEKAN
jgi:DNA-binding response OmpR family regulator